MEYLAKARVFLVKFLGTVVLASILGTMCLYVILSFTDSKTSITSAVDLSKSVLT